MAQKKHAVAEALLEAHVAFIVGEVCGSGLKAIVDEEIHAALVEARKLHLGDLVARDAVKLGVRSFVADLELGAGLAELVVEVARALHADGIHDRSTPADVLPDPVIERIVDQALAMKPLQEALIRGVAASPVYHDFASDLLYHGIRGYLSENAVTRNIPGAQSVMKLGRAALSKATPRLEASIEDSLKKYISQAVKTTTARSVDFLLRAETTAVLRQTVLDAWRGVKSTRIGGFRRQIGRGDAERIAAIGYDTWLQLRGSDYLGALIDIGIDRFFERYEEVPLTNLLDDLGISRELLVAETLRHATPLLKTLKKKKLLEALLRRRLRGFYHSEAVAAILDRAR